MTITANDPRTEAAAQSLASLGFDKHAAISYAVTMLAAVARYDAEHEA